ncbi:MAG: hypothetical protein EXX96DRAFT_128610 [Benjaminiella poitrasii]|nr:MAG: hypothetical protein EXX96DRAFT_128610 [Benjaminiella poitrasii]
MKNQQKKQQEAMARAAAEASQQKEGENPSADEQPSEQNEQQPENEQPTSSENAPDNEQQEEANDDEQSDAKDVSKEENKSDQPEDNGQEASDDNSEEEESDDDEDDDDDDDDDDDEELYRQMVGKKVNKSGMVVDKKTGNILGKLVEGKLKRAAGKKVGENGIIVNDKGKFVGRVEPIREESDDDDDDSDSQETDEEQGDAQNAEKQEEEPEGENPEEKPEEHSEETNDEDAKKVKDSEAEVDDAKDDAETAKDDSEEATESEKDEDQTEDADKESDNKVEKDAESAGKDAQDATENAEDVADDTTPKDKDVEDATEKAENVTEDAAEDGKDATEDDVEEETEEAAEDANKATENIGGATNDVEDADNNEDHQETEANDEDDESADENDNKEEESADEDKEEEPEEENSDKEDSTEEKDNTNDEDKPFNPYDKIDENSPEVRKSGKVVDMEDNVVGTVDKSMAPKLAGFKVDPDGNVINDEGHIVAKAELFKTEDEDKPFNPNDNVNEDSPEVRKSGKVVDMDDNIVGHIDKKIAPKLAGFKVDPDGNVISPQGDVVGRAEMIKPEEPEESEDENKPFNPNESVNENSPEVRKSGKVVDMEDNVIGTVDKERAPKLAGFKVDKDGNVINNEGHIVAKAELFKTEEESEDSPFNPNESVNEFSPEVRKSGKVLDMDDNVVGHVDKRLASKFAGFKVDEEGNIINNEGHIVGRVEMIKQEEEEEDAKDKPFNPNTMVDEHSPRVRKSGKVIDEDDNVVGTVDKNAARNWDGYPVDDDGNVIDKEGHVVGKAKMTGQKSEEERRKEAEEADERKIADQMSQAIQQSLDKIKPILKNITDTIDSEEAKSEKDRDEQKLVDTVKPLIEQGSAILEECNGAIRGLDPSGKIAKQAQAKSSSRKATPEEYHLAELLAQLSGEVSTTIDRAKKKIRNMPHAKKELSPLWNILQSPLLQILSAVGLLLTGVLGLVGNILNGLGLGSIVNSLLGGIGLNKILEGFGLGNALNLGGKKK